MAAPQRVAMVSDWFLPRLGGIELHLIGLSRELIKDGCAVEIHSTIPGPDMIEGVTVHRSPSVLAPKFDVAISPTLVTIIKRELIAGQYDVLHSHLSIVSPLSFAAIIAARQLGLPTVATFHSVLGRSSFVLRAIDAFWGWSQWPIVFTGVSELVTDELRAALPKADVAVLPNGVDVGYWHAIPPRRPTDGVLLVTAMRLEPRKRPMALLQAFATAQREALSKNIRLRLVIAGAGGELGRMKRFIAENDITDATLLGAQPRDRLRDLYAEAHAFVLPSIHESFGIAALEARCASLPVIAMRASGTAEFLRDGETALIADNDADLARAMVRIATDNELRARLARNDESVARYAWPNVVAAHRACYAHMLTRR